MAAAVWLQWIDSMPARYTSDDVGAVRQAEGQDGVLHVGEAAEDRHMRLRQPEADDAG